MRLGNEQYKVVISFHDELTGLEDLALTPAIVLSSTVTDGTFVDTWYKEHVSGAECYLYVMDGNNVKYYLCQNENQQILCHKNQKQLLAFHNNTFLVIHEQLTVRLGIVYNEVTGCHYLGLVPTENDMVTLLD